ncbi:MAG: hypothetical protein HY328_11030 [Chloroflexi bacterium]|nr:hypothetical protein [Chloroflexota bacterium]
MGTIRRSAISERRTANGRLRFHSLFAIRYSLFAFVLLLSSCASTRPVVKIGLLAPFEGVYRQEGYDALAAMRAAIGEQESDGIDVLPLAIDTSRDAARAAQKMLADPSVAAVIGPYWTAEGTAVEQSVDDGKWLYPYAPSGNDNWAVEAVDAAAAFAEEEGRTLIVAGRPPGWPEMKVETGAGADDVQAGQTVLWLGDAAAGAGFALAVWERLPGTPFGLYGAGVETFRQRVGEQMIGALFVVGWIDEKYPLWATSHSPNTPAAYTVYRQTADALKRLAGETTTTLWQPAIFILGRDGALVLPSNR